MLDASPRMGSSKFHTQSPQSPSRKRNKSFSNLLRKNRGDSRRNLLSDDPDRSDNSRHSSPTGRYSSHLSTFDRKSGRYNPRRNTGRSGSVGTASSSAASDPSSAAGSAFSQPSAFSAGSYVKNLPGGRTVAPYPPLQKQDSLDSLQSYDGEPHQSRKSSSFNSDALRRRIMARRSSRKAGRRQASPADSDGSAYDTRQSESPVRRNRSHGNLKSDGLGVPQRRTRSMFAGSFSKSAGDLFDKRSSIQSPRKSAPNPRMFDAARSPAQSPRPYEDTDDYKEKKRSPYRSDRRTRYDSPGRERSNTPVQRTRYSQEQEYTPKQSRVDSQRRGRKMRDPSSDRQSQTERSNSPQPYRKQRRTSPSRSPSPARPRRKSGGDRTTARRSSYESPRPGLNKAESAGAPTRRRSRSRSPFVARKRRADTYPSPKHQSRSPSPLPVKRRARSPDSTKSPAPKPRRQRSLTPPQRSSRSPYGSSSRRSPRAPATRARSPSAPQLKTYRLSELIPECRLYHIEARGGRRDFRKWFSTLPPNVKVDKDMKTDRGVFKKDNFATDKKLDEYLGINRSKSPQDDRHRRKRR